MNTDNLLTLDVDKLFESHSVSEIDGIHRKIQDEVEVKKENIRVEVSGFAGPFLSYI